MLVEGRVGPVTGADGASGTISLDRSGAQRIAQAHGEWWEPACRGNVFYGSTAVAGVDHAASLTTTAPFALYNPRGSDVDLVVLSLSMGYISGTLGSGTIVAASYVEAAVNAAPTGTAIVAGSTRLGLGVPKGRALTTVTLTAGALIMFPLWDIDAKLATTAVQNFVCPIDINGAIIVTPGTALVLAGIAGAAGSTPRVVFGAIWEEVARSS